MVSKIKVQKKMGGIIINLYNFKLIKIFTLIRIILSKQRIILKQEKVVCRL